MLPNGNLALKRYTRRVVSITFELSFNASADLPELAAGVNRVLGTAFERRDDDTFAGTLLGLPYVLGPNECEDDGLVRWSEYRYQLSSSSAAGSVLRRIQLETLVLAAFALHASLGIDEGMLTYDLQRVLARYAVIDDRWCDLESMAEIDPVGHINVLNERLDYS